MFIIEGTFKGRNIKSRTCFILTKEYGSPHKSLFSSDYGYVNIKDNLVSVDVVAQEQATGGGVQGAAGGAVLGFLIAGPLGTAIGAGMGSKKRGRDNTTLAITWANGDVWVVDGVETDEFAALRTAVVTSSPKTFTRKLTSKSHNSTKTKNKTKNKAYYKSKIGIKKPRFPFGWWYLKRLKGKTAKSTTNLPDISFINNITKVKGHDAAVKLFLTTFNKALKEYNDFKWQYFDVKIETEKEVQTIAQQALKKLIASSNQTIQNKKNIKALEVEKKKLEDSVEDYKSKIVSKNAELETAGFFSKGGIKKQIKTLENLLKDEKSKLSKNKGNLTRTKNNLESAKEIDSLEKGNELFIEIFKNLFPNDKQPIKTLKSKFNFNDEFFLNTYEQVFDEVWDKKIEDAINALKDKEKEQEKNKKKKQTAPKNSSTSKKSQLIEMKELLDDGVITKEEYEQSRKNILGIK